jgi:hypothetical protein
MTEQFELNTWQRIRRFAVPPGMIAACQARREAGDWRGALAAARVDTDIDLDAVAGRFGAQTADRIAGELAGLAPDLLRWHLPRALGGRTSLATGLIFTLATGTGPVDPDTAVLRVELPKTVDGSQRLRLTVAKLDDVVARELPGHLWHADEAPGLRAAYGGSAHRLPFLTPEGAPVPADAFAAAVGDDAPARAERAAAHLAADRLVEAWAEAGLTLDEELPATAPAITR